MDVFAKKSELQRRRDPQSPGLTLSSFSRGPHVGPGLSRYPILTVVSSITDVYFGLFLPTGRKIGVGGIERGGIGSTATKKGRSG